MKITDENGYIVFDENEVIAIRVHTGDYLNSIEVYMESAMNFFILNYEKEGDMRKVTDTLESIISKRDK